MAASVVCLLLEFGAHRPAPRPPPPLHTAVACFAAFSSRWDALPPATATHEASPHRTSTSLGHHSCLLPLPSATAVPRTLSHSSRSSGHHDEPHPATARVSRGVVCWRRRQRMRMRVVASCRAVCRSPGLARGARRCARLATRILLPRRWPPRPGVSRRGTGAAAGGVAPVRRGR